MSIRSSAPIHSRKKRGAEIARPDNSAPYRQGGHRETGQRGTRLNRSQWVEHPSAQEKIEHAE